MASVTDEQEEPPAVAYATTRAINLEQLDDELGGLRRLSMAEFTDEDTLEVQRVITVAVGDDLDLATLAAAAEAHVAVPVDLEAVQRAEFDAKVLAHPIVQALQAQNTEMQEALEWITVATLPLMFPEV